MTTDLAVTWGERLQAVRDEKNVSVRELASQVGVTTQYIYLLQTGRYSPSDDLRVKLAAALAVKVEDIWSYPEAS
jgi:DNA-binding XRE family transcriptional regulator